MSLSYLRWIEEEKGKKVDPGCLDCLLVVVVDVVVIVVVVVVVLVVLVEVVDVVLVEVVVVVLGCTTKKLNVDTFINH